MSAVVGRLAKPPYAESGNTLQEEKGKLLLEKYHLTALAKVEEIAKETLS
ncbi:MAG TPA: hypothetical protein EYP09_11650, partial [Anaerolineae bacterium]|nr:hypothetical protein [Anaerolineae bacterium]